MKYLKIGKYELALLGVVLVALCLRLILIAQSWPILNSDEGTMGIMARHIAYKGEWPIYFYGQYYMGVIQAYLGAVLFHIIGPSLFSLRLGLVILNVIFLVCMYLLTRTLYSRSFALFIVALLAFGSYYMLQYQLHVYGGYPETLVFGTVLLFSSSCLAITSSPLFSWKQLGRRLPLYAIWGCVVGLGLWSSSLILPLIAVSGFLILLFCWRELLRVVPLLCILLSLGLGSIPLIAYNISATPGNDSWSVMTKLQAGGSRQEPHTFYFFLSHMKETTLVSIPTITGSPFCPVSEESALGDPNSPHSSLCTLVHASWGGGYLLLFACALIFALWSLWMIWRKANKQPQDLELRRELARCTARVLLQISALMVLYLFVTSNAPTSWPGVEARYLIGLWLAWPVVLWPLWRLASPAFAQLKTIKRFSKIASVALLFGLLCMFVCGTALVLADAPRAQADDARYLSLTQHLTGLHISHIYTDYWTCNKLAFLSQEQVICAVETGNLNPTHNRVPGYLVTVKADHSSAYVYGIHDQYRGVLKLVAKNPSHYRRYVFDGYVVYQPV